ncbi:conjugal transfer nickase/helicase domain-containing protein [Pantoea agglomerans]|uniref:conjugal transfer nickase/helicase domain-containing protein n=1 Tax=Enterobacter agglomerans TaxID=549 RepID=UPI003CC957D5
MDWLKQGIQSCKIIINDTKAQVHTVVDTTYLVSPCIFQRYAQEHPQIGALAKQEIVQDWKWVQKRFERLQLHRKKTNAMNIWSCTVIEPRESRRLNRYPLSSNESGLTDNC